MRPPLALRAKHTFFSLHFSVHSFSKSSQEERERERGGGERGERRKGERGERGGGREREGDPYLDLLLFIFGSVGVCIPCDLLEFDERRQPFHVVAQVCYIVCVWSQFLRREKKEKEREDKERARG